MPVIARGDAPNHFAGHLCGARDPWPSNHGVRSVQAHRHILRHREKYYAPIIRAVAARKTPSSAEGTPRDIVMKLNAALGLLHKQMA